MSVQITTMPFGCVSGYAGGLYSPGTRPEKEKSQFSTKRSLSIQALFASVFVRFRIQCPARYENKIIFPGIVTINALTDRNIETRFIQEAVC
jgi:hypothetical protein